MVNSNSPGIFILCVILEKCEWKIILFENILNFSKKFVKIELLDPGLGK
jgi:hypothetical protein